MKTKAFALALALTFIGVTASAYAADVTAPVAPAKPAASATVNGAAAAKAGDKKIEHKGDVKAGAAVTPKKDEIKK